MGPHFFMDTFSRFVCRISQGLPVVRGGGVKLPHNCPYGQIVELSTIRCAPNSSCTSDDPCILHSPSFPVERAKLTDPRPKRAAKANGALDRPSQWVERTTMRVLCAAEMNKSATAERPFPGVVFQDFKGQEYIITS